MELVRHVICSSLHPIVILSELPLVNLDLCKATSRELRLLSVVTALKVRFQEDDNHDVVGA